MLKRKCFLKERQRKNMFPELAICKSMQQMLCITGFQIFFTFEPSARFFLTDLHEPSMLITDLQQGGFGMNPNRAFRFLNVGLPSDIQQHKLHGNLADAIRLVDLRLQKGDLPHALRCCMKAQREMMLRLPSNYPYSKEEALACIRRQIADFSEAEFDELADGGRIDWVYLDGQPHYHDRFCDTLLKTEPAIAARAGVASFANELGTRDDMLNRSMHIMKEEGSISHRIRIRATIRMKDEHFTPGMFARVHLPIPSECEQQSDIRIEALSPAGGMIAPVNAPQRTVCWEETMTENHPFCVEYSYVHAAVYHDTRAMQPAAQQPDFCTQEEEPHIVFTPYIRELAASLTQGISDPLEKARCFYNFITLNMKYRFQPEYFVLENISEGCARNFSGDCGVFALLFITLCRCAGIPAQWQSGLCAEPGDCGSHDWARFYIAPYGWLYADPSFGVSSHRCGNEERRQFYFGNLDGYRMVANSAFQHDFTIPKKHWRADPYDNQRGEMETEDFGLRFSQFDVTMETMECTELE